MNETQKTKSEKRNDLKGKRVLIVGFACTGLSIVRFLKKKGAIVTVTDSKPIGQLKGIQEVMGDPARRGEGIRVEAGGHPKEIFMDADLIVMSPGVPMTIEPVNEARKAGIDIMSEIELAYSFIDAPIIAVTGTNGKTTTTALLGRVLRDAGKSLFVGGNIGTPLIEYAMGDESYDYAVAEVSSFQLEGIRRFRPFISVLLNITEDHMDRYRDFKEYAEAKFNIFRNQGEGDIAVVNIDDPAIREWIKDNGAGFKARVIPFSSRKMLSRGVYFTGKEIVYSKNGSSAVYPTAEFKLKGIHNIENIMAVIAVAKECGIDDNNILNSVNNFSALPHRVEFVRELDGVLYYDDSKGTNIGALQKSLAGFEPPIILIAGGKDKGGDYKVLRDLVKEKVKLLILIGEARDKMKSALGGCTETLIASSMEDAVREAYENAEKGDIVLLSPACSSFDMFRDYKERGDVFRRLVEAL